MLEFYIFQSIAEAVTVTIPWAWNEIRTAFKAAIDAIPDIVKSPKPTIDTIGQSYARHLF